MTSEASVVVDERRSDGLSGTETLGAGESRSDQRPRASNAVTCGTCGAWWTGLAAAHCGACHQTFGGVTLFDRHREQYGERGKCVPPTEIKKGSPMELRDGVWRGPEMDEQTKAKRFAKK